jgi:23S rRNA (guanosine2251-2'-O)-methyltransferase
VGHCAPALITPAAFRAEGDAGRPEGADNQGMSSPKVLFGFHAVGVRLKTAPQSVVEVYFESTRRDARMRQFLERARESGVRLIEADSLRIAKLAGSHGHQGVAARVQELPQVHSLDELLEGLEAAGTVPLLLVLDGITDPHNLGACLRVADGAGAHAVIAPKDHAAGINATVAKVASGAAETMPYFMVTNLARTLGELKERNIWIIGTSDDAPKTLYQVDLKGPVALVLGAEGDGMRQLTRKTCDELVSIPMAGAVESLNVSVASGVCLYEALRQRS